MTGLDALKEINKVIPYAHITNEYKIIEKELKALEIIKEKRVDIEFLFEEWEEQSEYALENYNMNHEIELTKEEFDLLKEILL